VKVNRFAPAGKLRVKPAPARTYRVQRVLPAVERRGLTQRPPLRRPLLARSTVKRVLAATFSEKLRRVPAPAANGLTVAPERAARNADGLMRSPVIAGSGGSGGLSAGSAGAGAAVGGVSGRGCVTGVGVGDGCVPGAGCVPGGGVGGGTLTPNPVFPLPKRLSGVTWTRIVFAGAAYGTVNWRTVDPTVWSTTRRGSPASKPSTR
jgi:hypothetical protein